MGPAGLMQALKKMKTVSLEHTLASEQTPKYTKASVNQQGSCNQERAKCL
jgi:hypothetical protein